MKPLTILHEKDPVIAYYNQVASPEECQELIDLAKENLKPSNVIGPTELKLSESRKSDNTWLDHHQSKTVIQVTERIASIVGRPLHYAEMLQVARYQVGGKFDAHFDAYFPSTEPGKAYLFEGGQRILTALLYLNTVKEGGETCFPELSLEVSPNQGNLLVFENTIKETNEAHPLSIHAARPVKEGEKWIATLWFREKPQYSIQQVMK